MAIDIIPFLGYLILFCFLINLIPFYKKSGIWGWSLVCLFSIKVAVGVLYGLYFNLPSQRAGADTLRFYRESIPETQLLLHQPILFVKSLFINSYQESNGLLASASSYWNDLKDNIIIKLVAVCNVFTHNNYFTDVIFFNFIYLFGLVAFYRVVKSYCNANKYLLLFPIFLMPSFLFWGSGIHKDGLLFSALGVVLYCLNGIIRNKIKTKYFIALIICLPILFFIKIYLAVFLVPAFIAWWLAKRNPQRKQLCFIAVYSGCILLLVVLSLLGDHYNILNYVVDKQHAFLLLNGNSAIKVPQLNPTLISALHYLPTAIDIAFIRPHISEIKNAAYALAFVETVMNALLILVALWFMSKQKTIPTFFLFCFYFAISVLLLDGYTVTFTGAIVRYRSLMLPLTMAPIVGMISFKRRHKG